MKLTLISYALAGVIFFHGAAWIAAVVGKIVGAMK